MPAVIFKGSNVRALKSGLDLAGQALIFNGTFSAANNTADQTITGFAFTSSMKAFNALVSVSIDATTDLSESFEIEGINTGSDWIISITSQGQDTQATFSITSGGQMRITTGNYSGFVSASVRFRAETIGT